MFDSHIFAFSAVILLLARIMGQCCFARCRRRPLSYVTRVGSWPPPGRAGLDAWPVRQPTLHGGTVRLHLVRATPCYLGDRNCVQLLDILLQQL